MSHHRSAFFEKYEHGKIEVEFNAEIIDEFDVEIIFALLSTSTSTFMSDADISIAFKSKLLKNQ